MTTGDRVKFETNGGWYNSGIIISMDENSCLVEVDTLGHNDSIPLPYYVRGPRDLFIAELEARTNTLEQYLAPSPDLSFYKRKEEHEAESEDENMTNYEWLVKSNPELIKSILARHLGKEDGTPKSCLDIVCGKCEFARRNLRDADLGDYQKHCGDYPFCRSEAKKWLEAEHEPPYKKGDIIVGPSNEICVVINIDCFDEGIIGVSRYIDDNSVGVTMPINEIKKKIGYIESEV